VNIIDDVRSIFSGTTGSAAAPVMKIVQACEAMKPSGYRADVEKALAYYRGSAQAYVRQNLSAVFPKSAAKMMPITFGLVPRVVREQARVFGQIGERWESDNAADVDAVEALVTGSQLVQRLKEVDRVSIAARACFLRCCFVDDEIELRIFTPERTWLRMTGDSTGLGEDVVFELAGVMTPKGIMRRFEWWHSDGVTATVTIQNEKGDTLVPAQVLEYKDAEGKPMLPIVRFSTMGLDAGFWVLPNQNLLAAAQAIDAQATNAAFVASLSGYPQFIGEDTDPAQPADWKQKLMQTGPETVMVAPNRGRITSITRTADVAGFTEWRQAFIADVEASESIPPGSILGESRSSVSGAALTIERAPLTELRQDHAEAYRPSVEDLLEVMRVVWNAHRTDAVISGALTWTEGAMTAPMGPSERAAADTAEIANGTSSAVRVLMRERGITREAAIELAAEIADENAKRTAGMLNDAGSKVFDTTADPADETPDTTA